MNVLTTKPEAEQIASLLNANGFHVAEIYIPRYTSGPFSTPGGDGEARFYHFRFDNGASGFNAGLVRWSMQTAPTRWPQILAADIQREANKPHWPWEED